MAGRVKMKKVYWIFLVLPYLICLYIIAHQLGCHLIFPHKAAPCTTCYTYSCTGDANLYPLYNKGYVDATLLPDVSTHPAKPYPTSMNCNVMLRASTNNHPNTTLNPADGLVINAKAYCDGPWVINRIVDKESHLKGSAWIRTAAKDRSNQADPFMEIVVKEAPVALFIAYDDRATTKPDWLTGNYDPVAGSTVTIFNPNDKGTIDLGIWRIKDGQGPKKGVPFKIPGNLHYKTTKPVWPSSVPSGSEAMYLVILQPEQDKNKKLKPVDSVPLSHKVNDPCVEQYDANLAQQQAINEWNKLEDGKYKNLGYAFENIKCTSTKTCQTSSEKISKTIKPVMSYAWSSEIQFSPPVCMANIDIPTKGKSYPNQPVNGTLHFEYTLDKSSFMTAMQIHDMTLYLPDIWEFTDITVDLLAPCTAKWDSTGTPPLKNMPCQKYQIRKGAFQARIQGTHDGKIVVVHATNRDVIPVQINEKKRTFLFSGDMSGSIPVNGDDTPVEVAVDLTGLFMNFAPNASLEETTHPFSECEENSNKDSIYLDASMSFDPDDHFGTQTPLFNIVEFHWYEDFGRVTQKDWGTGKKLIIAPHQLGFGVHDFTLLVRDNHDITDTDTIEVTVFDKKPPVLTFVPPDIYRLVMPDFIVPFKVAIGEASATDTCACGDVLVTHDGPEDLMFEPGDHVVTWKADDGRGNVATAEQKVHLWQVVKAPTIRDLDNMASRFDQPFTSAEAYILASKAEEKRGVDLESQRLFIRQLNELVSNLSVRQEDQALHQQLMASCRNAEALVDKAETLIDLSAGAGGTEREKLLEQAAECMAEERFLMKKIHETLARMAHE